MDFWTSWQLWEKMVFVSGYSISYGPPTDTLRSKGARMFGRESPLRRKCSLSDRMTSVSS